MQDDIVHIRLRFVWLDKFSANKNTPKIYSKSFFEF